MIQFSFSINGFWFHLVQISNYGYQDQNGSLWHKKGNQLHSDGGGFIHDIRAEDSCRKDYSPLVRQMAGYSRKRQERAYLGLRGHIGPERIN